jgi:hypothetical protein
MAYNSWVKACPERSEGSFSLSSDPSKLRMRAARTLNPER